MIAGKLTRSTANRLRQQQLHSLCVAWFSRKTKVPKLSSECPRIQLRVLSPPLPDFLRNLRELADVHRFSCCVLAGHQHCFNGYRAEVDPVR